MKKSSALILIALIIFAAHAAMANPFVSGKPSDINASFMSSFTGPFMQQIIAIQTHIHKTITDQIELLKEGQSTAALWELLLLSFGYGVFHVLAPGHGKVIVGSYFLGNKASWRDGVWAGMLMAIGHTITAVGIVFALYLIFGLGQLAVLDNARYMELAGYGLIALIGLWLLLRALRNAPECNACKHDHNHAHHHDHDHDDHVRPSTGLFAAASLVPCTGSMIILLFTLANNVLWAGVLAVIAIALGMWLTVSAIGIASMLLRRMVVGNDDTAGPKRRGLIKAMRVLAALVVIATGSLLFAGTFYSLAG